MSMCYGFKVSSSRPAAGENIQVPYCYHNKHRGDGEVTAKGNEAMRGAGKVALPPATRHENKAGGEWPRGGDPPPP